MDAPPHPARTPPPSKLARWGPRVGCGAAGFLAALLTLMIQGLEHSALDPTYAGPAPLTSAVRARFTYSEQKRPVQVFAEFNHAEVGSAATRWVQFPVTTPGQTAAHLVQVIYYQAKRAGRRPAVLVTPIMGGSREVAHLVAGELAKRGVHAAIVLRAESYLDGAARDERLERVLRTAVVDRRRAIDWLQGLDEVDPARVGALGVSLGGVVTTLLASVEPRLRATVLVMAGGDLADVIVRSQEQRLRRFVRERAARGITAEETGRRIRAALPSDPLALAPHCDARRVLMVATRRDRSVPFANQERLHAALGRPERYVLPTGHYGAALYLPFILDRALDFLEERLGR